MKTRNISGGVLVTLLLNFSALLRCFALFGWGRKTGINCFVLITGYFMCQSQASMRKFLKLVLEVEFYKLLFCLVFCSADMPRFR